MKTNSKLMRLEFVNIEVLVSLNSDTSFSAQEYEEGKNRNETFV